MSGKDSRSKVDLIRSSSSTKNRHFMAEKRPALKQWENYRTRLLNEWLVEFLDRVEEIRIDAI